MKPRVTHQVRQVWLGIIVILGIFLFVLVVPQAEAKHPFGLLLQITPATATPTAEATATPASSPTPTAEPAVSTRSTSYSSEGVWKFIHQTILTCADVAFFRAYGRSCSGGAR